MGHGEQTRANILTCAHQLFIQQGFHGTSMRQIAAYAGIALGTIYNHFPGKEAIFKTIFLQSHPYHDVLPLLSQARGETPEAFVRNTARLLLRALRTRPDFLNLLFIEHVEFKGVHSQELLSTILPQSEKIINDFVKGQPAIRPIPAAVLLWSFLSLFISYYLGQIILERSSLIEFDGSAFDYFLAIYLHGILAGDEA
jgi:AcrR family transcriptional regulator